MIDERMEEQASLYVLGVLTPEEVRDFEAALAGDSELQQLVIKLSATRDAAAGSVPLVTPRPELKKNIFAEIESLEKSKKATVPVSTLSSSFWSNSWLPWALAACLLIFASILWGERDRLQSQLGEQSVKMEKIDQMAKSLMAETNDLHQAVAKLESSSKLDKMRIALLGSLLSDAPKAVAVSLWDNSQQKGVFVVQNLKPLPADKDYQLWVMDPKYKTPVSAGVFQVDAQGNVRFQFTPDKTISAANKFAVTMEPKGGLPVPTLKNLVLIGS